MSAGFSKRTAPSLYLALWFAAGSLSARVLPVAPQPVALIPSAALWGLTVLRPGGMATAASVLACGLFSGRLPLPGPTPPPETLEGAFEGEVLEVRQGSYGGSMAETSLRFASGGRGRGAFPARLFFDGISAPAVGDVVRFRSSLSLPVRDADGTPLYFGKVPEGGWVRLDESELSWSPRKVRSVLARAAGEQGPEAGVFRALAMGDRSALPWQVTRAFRRAGTAHLLAISGLHLACAFAFGLVMAVPLSVLACGRSRPRAAAALRLTFGLAAASMYLAVAGLSASAGRALTWALLSGAAVLAGRHCDALQGAGLCLLLAGSVSRSVQPDLSLGLSLLAFVGIVRSINAWDGAMARTWRLSLGAFFYTCPVVVSIFCGLPVLSPVFNLLVGVPFTMVLIPSALAVQWFCLFWPAAAPALVGGWKACAAPVLALQGWAARWDFAYLALNPVGVILAAATSLAAAITWEKRGRGLGLGVALIATIALAGALGNHVGAAREDGLQVLFPNMGQGDSIVFVADGTVAMVDCGPVGTTHKEPAVLGLLDREGIRNVDLLVLTHLHPDHAGAVGALLMERKVGRIAVPAAAGGELVELIEAIAPRSRPRLIAVSEGDQLRAGGVTFVVHYPPLSTAPASGNEGSLVLQVQWRDVNALLTGDAPWEAVARAAERTPRLALFKLPHHGSARGFDPSGAQALLSRLRSDGAEVVCTSPPEGGKLPSAEVRKAFFRSGLRLRFSGQGTGLRFVYYGS